MRLLKTIIKAVFAISASLIFFSCTQSKAYPIQDLSDLVEYAEVPENYNFGDIMRNRPEFKHLEKKDMNKLSSLLSDKKNTVWLRINFKIDKELLSNQIGLYIGHLRNASLLFFNGSSIRKYGEMPPAENSAGFMSEFYMFPSSTINREGINTIYIQLWIGSYGSISDNIFISTPEYIYPHSERTSFFNSRITIAFTFISLLISFLYIVLYFILRKFKENRMYLIYALMNLYTAHFLLFFCSAELTWLKPSWISYLTVLKLTLCYGGFTTVYFAASFVITYLGHEPSKKELRARLAMLTVSLVIAFALPSYSAFVAVIPYLVLFTLIQFCFSTPKIIKAFFNKSTRPKTIGLIQGFSPVVISVTLDAFFRLVLKKSDWPLITLYCWQITILIFLWRLLRSFGNIYIHNTQLKDQLQEFNANLEEVVALRTKELSETNYVLQRGLETVSHVQKNFLPPVSNVFKGWDLSVYYKPLDSDVSGDLYDYYSTNNCLDGLGIFDVSGHGIPAGLMTILAKGIISQHFLSGLKRDISVSSILEDINDTYIREKVDIENYITGLLFRFSEFNQNDVCSVEFANAGHPYPLLYSAAEDEIKELKSEDPNKQYGLIGIEGMDVSFPPVSLRMGIGDIIVCFTDGLTEAFNENGEEFSKERVIEILKNNKDKSSDDILTAIKTSLLDFTYGKSFSDDLTIIVLKRTNSKEYIEGI